MLWRINEFTVSERRAADSAVVFNEAVFGGDDAVKDGSGSSQVPGLSFGSSEIKIKIKN